jgi:hypothetical protein
MQQQDDPYFKLRPRGATPPDECCSCDEVVGVYLAHTLTVNPVHCLSCRGEVAPERIAFDVATAESIASWNGMFGSVYSLWRDSGEYEHWAEGELIRRDSPVNKSGMVARESLSRFIPTKYLWFWNESRPASCPNCGSGFRSTEGAHLVCSSCEVCV